MRDLKKNQIPLYYATHDDNITVYERDANGNIVYMEIDGEQIAVVKGTAPGYNEPVQIKLNVSPGKGQAEIDVFGSTLDFTRAISTTNTSLPIDELTLIWIDNEPTYVDGLIDPNSANYKVVSVARGINSLLIAIKHKE